MNDKVKPVPIEERWDEDGAPGLLPSGELNVVPDDDVNVEEAELDDDEIEDDDEQDAPAAPKPTVRHIVIHRS